MVANPASERSSIRLWKTPTGSVRFPGRASPSELGTPRKAGAWRPLAPLSCPPGAPPVPPRCPPGAPLVPCAQGGAPSQPAQQRNPLPSTYLASTYGLDLSGLDLSSLDL